MILSMLYIFSSAFFCLCVNADKLHLYIKYIVDTRRNCYRMAVKSTPKEEKNTKINIYLLIIYSVHKMAPICFLCSCWCTCLFTFFIFFLFKSTIKESIEFLCTWQFAMKLLHCTLLSIQSTTAIFSFTLATSFLFVQISFYSWSNDITRQK